MHLRLQRRLNLEQLPRTVDDALLERDPLDPEILLRLRTVALEMLRSRRDLCDRDARGLLREVLANNVGELAVVKVVCGKV